MHRGSIYPIKQIQKRRRTSLSHPFALLSTRRRLRTTIITYIQVVGEELSGS